MFSIGFLAVSQAQVLVYSLENQSNLDWEFKIGDASGNAAYYANIPGPSAPIVNFFNGFTFPLEFGGQNSFGCSAYENVPGPTAGANVPFFCWVPSAINYNVTVQQVIPFVLYNMILEFS